MDRNQIFEIVKKYILNQMPNLKPARITESASLVDDLGADSANLMMLVMDMEAEFNMTVEDEAISTIRTVGDIVDYIEKRV